MRVFDSNKTLNRMKAVGRVIEYWKEKLDGKTYLKRKILVEIGDKTLSGYALKGTNQYKYKADLMDGNQYLICVNSNVVFLIEKPIVGMKTKLRKQA